MRYRAVDDLLRERERTWAWLGRKIETSPYRMWRLSRGEVPWRHREAVAAAAALGVPFEVLFGHGEHVLPAGRERALPGQRPQAIACERGVA